ncbi:MAG: hypothetical protein Alpg2KO_16510 [Alphaproteobacteria bacterium]
MRKMVNNLKSDSKNRGASLLSYGLIVGLISVFALSSVTSVGSNVVSLFDNVADTTGGVVTQNGAGSSSEPTPAATHASCKEAFDAGITSDGLQQIDPDGSGGAAPFDAWCDMSSDGGGWTLVIRALGAETGVDGGVWLTASDFGASSSPSPTGNSFKFSDSVINALQDDGVFRLIADGTYTYERFVTGCTYSHDSTTQGGTCNVTYPDLNFNPGDAHGNPNPGTMPLNYIYGISDWPGPHDAYFITSNNYYAEGDNGTWWLERGPAGTTSGSGTDRRCTGIMSGCNYTMWVR